MGQIKAWWSKHKSCQVGIVLDATGLVVADVDSAEGEDSLARLAGPAGRAGLPQTYEVVTSRGRHLYYRIPDGGRTDVASQFGGQHGRPGLDVKTTWLLIVPGTVSGSGHLYRGSWDHVPEISELPVLPDSAWAQIESQARDRVRKGSPSRSRGSTGGRGREVPPELLGGRLLKVEGPAGARLESLLANAGDGRDGRVFRAVLAMAGQEVEDRDIWATLVASPLGGKVLEQRDPADYLLRKIDSAVGYLDATQREWDQSAWLDRVLRSGLGDSKIRVLVYLNSRAGRNGIVTAGTNRIALGAALSATQAAAVLTQLINGGWLTVQRDYDSKTRTPRTFALESPEDGQIPDTGSRTTPSTSPSPLSIPVRDLSGSAGHDAFRTAARGQVPALGSQFRVLCLLAGGPRSVEELAVLLKCTSKTVERGIERLTSHGLVTEEDEGVTMTSEHLHPLLAEVARKAGTEGMGQRQLEAYLAKCERDAEHRERMGIVGTEEWRMAHIKDCEALFDAPEPPAFLDEPSPIVIPEDAPDLKLILKWWEEVGVQRIEVAEMMVDTLEGTYFQAERAFKDFDWSSVGQRAA